MNIDMQSRQNSIDLFINKEMKEKHIPGVAIAIMESNNFKYIKGYGYSNLEHRIPITLDSVFEICSITKQFTVAAVILLVENGILSLDKPITDYLTELPSGWKDITILHLLSATSGMKDYLNDSFKQDVPLKASNQIIIQFIINQELNFKPGDQWAYNNSGFVILSHLVEKLSGLNFHEFLKKNILKELGCNIIPNDLREIVPNRVNGYEYKDNKWINRQPTYAGKLSYGDGELLATIEDLAKWGAIWSTDKYLKLSSKQQIGTPIRLNNGIQAITPNNANYGFGCFIETTKESTRYWTPGSGEGFSTTFMYFPKDKLTIIVLCNLEEFLLADSLALGLKELL